MWVVDSLKNGTQRTYHDNDEGAAKAEVDRLDQLGVVHKVAWFCTYWEATA